MSGQHDGHLLGLIPFSNQNVLFVAAILAALMTSLICENGITGFKKSRAGPALCQATKNLAIQDVAKWFKE